jgi:hypothetical protein
MRIATNLLQCFCALQVALQGGVGEEAVRHLKASIEATTLGQVCMCDAAVLMYALPLSAGCVRLWYLDCCCARLCTAAIVGIRPAHTCSHGQID